MQKRFPRKRLDLNKQTIVNLDRGSMRGIQGGSDPETLDHTLTSYPVPTCNPCPETLGTQDTLNTEQTDP